MSIRALPADTARLLGSTQVLTSSLSLVKELLDNAIDAQCSSVQVEISSNSLDTIQVRDDGHGIAPRDRHLVAKRHCTSKIETHAELQSIGGKSLGFRGEALSCCAEISARMTITTRIENEAPGTALHIAKNGDVERQEVTSHPLGTTVRVSGLFDRLPVRKQTAEKVANKTLLHVKKLLQSYAFARPSIRFSLRILKQPQNTNNWTYAPKYPPTLYDTAMKVVGNDCASQCYLANAESDGFAVECFLPTQDADPTKIGGHGQFLSVDGRPVVSTRGTMKRLIKLFKEKIHNSNLASKATKDAFLCLHLKCPPQSYDPNIEPGKDSVQFAEEEKVLRVIALLFDQCYGASSVALDLHHSMDLPRDNGPYDLQGSRGTPHREQLHEQDAYISPASIESSLPSRRSHARTPAGRAHVVAPIDGSRQPIQKPNPPFNLPTPEKSSPLKPTFPTSADITPQRLARRGRHRSPAPFDIYEDTTPSTMSDQAPLAPRKWTALNDASSTMHAPITIHPRRGSSHTSFPSSRPPRRKRNTSSVPAIQDDSITWFDHLIPRRPQPSAQKAKTRPSGESMDIRAAFARVPHLPPPGLEQTHSSSSACTSPIPAAAPVQQDETFQGQANLSSLPRYAHEPARRAAKYAPLDSIPLNAYMGGTTLTLTLHLESLSKLILSQVRHMHELAPWTRAARSCAVHSDRGRQDVGLEAEEEQDEEEGMASCFAVPEVAREEVEAWEACVAVLRLEMGEGEVSV